ncbi:MAG: hypothetical protein IID40_11615 [Planctomycetes bacterium]|nr:hypothetical protein [Planctomycetota bacterium]
MDERVAEPTPWPRGRTIRRVGIGLLLFVLVWNSLYYWPYLVDDTFISLRYARNLIDGAGLVYNPGQYVEGYSNFSWVMLEAALLGLGLPVLTSLKVLGLMCGLATAWLTLVLAGRIVGRSADGAVARLLALALICLNTGLAAWTQAGLETAFFALLVVAMCLRFEVEQDRTKARPWSALLFGLAWMTRPEAPIYGLYFLVRRLSVLRRRRLCPADLWWLVGWAVVVVPYEAWGLWYYGHLLPNTYAAKIGGVGSDGLAGLGRKLLHQPLLVDFATAQGWGFAGLLLLGAVGCFRRIRSLPLVAWLPLVCGVIFVLHAQRDWMARYRLLVPVMSFLFAAVGFGLANLYGWARPSRGWLAIWCVAVGVLMVDYARHQMFGAYPRGVRWLATQARDWTWWADVPAQLSRRDYPFESRAWSVLENLPPEATVCARDIGFIGFLTGNPIWDTAGLFTPAATRGRQDRSDQATQAMLDDLWAADPACLYLFNQRARTNDARLVARLQSDPRARSQYSRHPWPAAVGPSGVTYLRDPLPAVDLNERVRRAIRSFPEYEDRARRLLAARSRR